MYYFIVLLDIRGFKGRSEHHWIIVLGIIEEKKKIVVVSLENFKRTVLKEKSDIFYFFTDLSFSTISSSARSAQSYCCHLGCTRLRVRPHPRHTFG